MNKLEITTAKDNKTGLHLATCKQRPGMTYTHKEAEMAGRGLVELLVEEWERYKAEHD